MPGGHMREPNENNIFILKHVEFVRKFVVFELNVESEKKK